MKYLKMLAALGALCVMMAASLVPASALASPRASPDLYQMTEDVGAAGRNFDVLKLSDDHSAITAFLRAESARSSIAGMPGAAVLIHVSTFIKPANPGDLVGRRVYAVPWLRFAK